MKPLVSIIMPMYNVEDYVWKALQSVVNQKQFPLNEIELIIVNDGSTDRSLENVRKFMKNEPRLAIRLKNYYRQNGASVARNTGAELAKGDFLLYLDADDLLYEDCVSECIKAFESNPSVGFVYSDHAAVKPFTEVVPKKEDILYIKTKNDFDLKNFLERKYNCVGHVKVVRKSINLPFDPKLISAEDSDWVIRLGLNDVNFYHVPKVLYFWRRGVDSITSRESKTKTDKFHNLVFERGWEMYRRKFGG